MGILNRLRNTFSKGDATERASEELAWHLEQRVQSYINAGMTPAEAQQNARAQLGNVTLLEEQTADSDVVLWLDAIKRDIALAFRMLRRAPTVTAIAAFSLALGIGANTMVFTLMKQVVLDYLPVPAPEQLVILHNQEPEMGHTSSNGMNSSFSYPLYQDLNAGTSRIFDGVLSFRSQNVSVSGHESTSTVRGDLVSGNFFQVLQVTPWRGRLFTQDDDRQPGANAVVVLGYGLWKRNFGGEAGIVNRTILLNKHPYLVVGIAPPQFYGTDVSARSDLFVPMAMKTDVIADTHLLSERLDHWCSLIARLKPGVSRQQAQTALAAIYPPLRDQELPLMKTPTVAFKKKFSMKQIELSAGGQGYASLRDDLSSPLKILTAMVGIVLLITMTNVANLLVARGVARQREMAIRLSVGAGKAALARQLLIESLVLALLGGTLGVAIAFGGTPLLLRALSFDLNAASLSAYPDWHVLLFASILSLGAGLLFGLLPAWQSTRTDVAPALRTEGSMGHTGHAGWLRQALVIGQIALSLLLVTSALLFTRSLQNLKNINVGFTTERLLKFDVDPLRSGYSQPRIRSFGEELRRRLAAIPGVEGAAIATVPILQGDDEGGSVTVEGAPPHLDQEESRNAYDRNLVSPGFFSIMRIPVTAGRQFTEADSLPTTKVAIVNQTFVNRYIPGRNPLGVHFGFGSGNSPMTQTIIGVVADSEHSSLRSKIVPFVYQPYLADTHLSSLNVYVRVTSSEQSVLPAVRNVVHGIDADLPVNDLASMTEIIDESLFVERSLGYLSIGFAALATLLSIVGLYGVMSYAVSSRQRELAIRMAIGATPERLLMMVLRQSAYLGIVGILLGIPCVLAAESYIRSSLYGVQPNDPFVWISSVAVLIGVALLSGFVPAWHAARIDPHVALRSD